MITHSELHYSIINHVLKYGYAPSVDDLARQFSEPENNVQKALQDLEEYHGIVLNEDKVTVKAIHPFALFPTSFRVESENQSWWGNCSWCSLGVAALLQKDCVIRTRVGGDGDPINLTIRSGELLEKDLLIHFPIPMMNAWDDVVYTCSTMLTFQTMQQIEGWCERHDLERGDVQTAGNIWELSKVWYGKHLEADWTKWTADEAAEIFHRFNLTHPVWNLRGGKERF